MKKSYTVAFIVDADKLATILGTIADDVSNLTVAEATTAPLPRGRMPVRKPRPGNSEKNDPHVVARSPVGRSVLTHLRQRVTATSSEIAVLLANDGIWSPASASPTLSRLLRGGYVKKPDPSPGAPFHFVKEPEDVA